ncbi:MAG: S8 family serine peptidase [Bacteroidota bacterium]
MKPTKTTNNCSNFNLISGLIILGVSIFISSNTFSQGAYVSKQWHIENTGQEAGYLSGHDINVVPCWNNITEGDPNAVVVVIDRDLDRTFFDDHPDLAGKLVNTDDFTYCNNIFPFSPGDPIPVNNPCWIPGMGIGDWEEYLGPYGGLAHAINIAGIIAANGNVKGVAPNVKIMHLKTCGNDPKGRFEAINYALDRHNEFPLMVITCSWSLTEDMINCPIYNNDPTYTPNFSLADYVETTLQRTADENVPIFFAAGNNGDNFVKFLAKDPRTIAVGSMPYCDLVRKETGDCSTSNDIDYGLADYGSNYGNELDISAPGRNILTTDAVGNDGRNDVDVNGLETPPYNNQNFHDVDYHFFGGTSSATPQVAAAAALMLSVNPCLTSDEIRTILQNTADKVGPYTYIGGRCDELGYGRLNVYEAVLAVQNSQPITTNTTWNSVNYTINGPLIITNNSYLAIQSSSTIEFGPNGSIIVEPGSFLFINNSTLTSITGCDILWKGIELQTDGDNYAQGSINNSVLENAKKGLFYSPGSNPPPTYCSSYASLTVYNCTFKNNQVSIKIENLRPGNLDCNLGVTFFDNCTFIIDNTAPTGISHPVTFIEIDGANDVQVLSSTFTTSLISLPDNQKPIAINSNNTPDLSIYFNCNFSNLSIAIQSVDDILRVHDNTFQNITKGIQRFNPNSGPAFIFHNDFHNVKEGIFIQSGSYDEISYNYFDIPSSYDAYGLFMIGCGGFHIEDNTLAGAGVPGDYSYGMVFENSAALGGVVFDNEFLNTDFHIQSQGVNELLKIRCNDFTNPGTKSWTVVLDDAMHGELKSQGNSGCDVDPGQAAGNHWLDLCSGSTVEDIFVANIPYEGPVNFMYFAHNQDQLGDATTIPECSSPAWKNTNHLHICATSEQGLPNSSCDDFIQGIIGDPDDDLEGYIGGLINLKEDYLTKAESEKETLKKLTNSGNAQALFDIILQNKPPGKVKNALLDASPFLSDNVMITALSKKSTPLPGGVIKEILVANSQLSKKVMKAVDKRIPALPPGIIKEIDDAQTIISDKELLEHRIVWLLGEVQLIENEMSRQRLKYKEKVKAKEVLEKSKTTESKKVLAEVLLDEQQIAQSRAMLDTVIIKAQSDTLLKDSVASARIVKESQNFYKLMNTLLDIADSGKTIIEIDSIQEQTIREVVNSKAKVAAYKAQVMLKKAKKENFAHSIIKIQQNMNKMAGSGNSNDEEVKYPGIIGEEIPGEFSFEGYHLSNYPNPFRDGTIIGANIPGHFDECEIVITDIVGDVIKQFTLKKGHNFIEITTADIKYGIYFYSLISKGHKIKTKKMVHIR